MTKDQNPVLKMIRESQTLADDGSITSRELAALLGCGADKARTVIGDLLEAGKLERCRSRRTQRLTGIIAPVWAYRPTAD